jgi:hypothetical protein|tara:strand:- start:2020 stop:2277 length:258 start_codon:yes stop_codon:yes gene_type:complete
MGDILPNWELHPETLTADSRYCPVNSSEPTIDTYQRTWLFPVEQEVVEQDNELGVTLAKHSMAKVAQGYTSLVSNIQKILVNLQC